LPLIWVCHSGVGSLLREFDLNRLPCHHAPQNALFLWHIWNGAPQNSLFLWHMY
jgi:hypothetical protein